MLSKRLTPLRLPLRGNLCPSAPRPMRRVVLSEQMKIRDKYGT